MKRTNNEPVIDMLTDTITTVNENGDKENTVIWSESDGVMRTQTTIIHKKVPSVGVILLTALVFTIVGALISSMIFFTKFSKSLFYGDNGGGIHAGSQKGDGNKKDSRTSNGGDDSSTLPTPQKGNNEHEGGFSSLADIYDENVDGVVVVYSYNGNPARYSNLAGTGTGFFVSEDGYIFTNAHVVADATDVRIATHDDRILDAKIVGKDVKTDIAVLKVEMDSVPKVLVFGDSSEVRTGDFVLAIGHPTGDELSFTATFGMVGAVDRSVNIDGVRNSYIQIDAAINPGNSGGPLFDLSGRVIGVNSAKTVVASYDENGEPISAEGLGFALPINMVIETAKGIIEQGGIKRPGIGISTIFIDIETADKNSIPVGGLVYTVTEGGPADEAGLYADDIITQVDGIAITSADTLGNYLGGKSIGDRVEVKYWRDGEYRTCTLTIGDLNSLSGKILDDAYGGKKYGIR